MISRKRSRQIGMLLWFGVIIAMGGFWLFRRSEPFIPIEPSVQFLAADSRIPPQPVSAFERWVPISWSWLWRLHDFVRGPLPGILIDAKVIDCAMLPEQMVADLARGHARGETNGMRGWILDNPPLAALGRKLETTGQLITRPRVQTAHGIQSTLFVGSAQSVLPGSQVGFTFDLLPLIQRDGTDLITILTLTEAVTNRSADVPEAPSASGVALTPGISVHTNLAAGIRWRFLDGTGLFLLCPPASNETRRLGVIVSATVQRPK